MSGNLSCYLKPDELIAQSQRDMAAMQDTLDSDKASAQLIKEVHSLHKIINALTDCLQDSYAQTLVSNAYTTIIKRKLQDKCTELKNTKKQQQRANGSSKIKAWFLTLPQFQDKFNTKEVAWFERDRLAADKEAQKTAKKAEQEAKICHDAVSKVFDLPLTSSKLKDNLLTLALALQLPTAGLNAQDLHSSIAAHLNKNADTLHANPHFSGLYAQRHCHVANATASSRATAEPVKSQQRPPSKLTPNLIIVPGPTAHYLHYTNPSVNHIGNERYYQHYSCYNPFGEGSSQNHHNQLHPNYPCYPPHYSLHPPYNHWNGPN